MKLWGGRFKKGPTELFEKFSQSLDFDRELLEADVLGSKEYASALKHVGIFTEDEHERICAAFDEILIESSSLNFFDGAADEDIHTLVIRKLGEKVGDLAGKIHTGRSRNEQVATDLRIWIRKEIQVAQQLLAKVMEALLNLAKREPDVFLPGYTHLRRAQPILWAHYLLAYFEMFNRDWERFAAAYRSADVLPLGSGALAGSGLPFDRQLMAENLGFSQISRNSLDGVSDRDFALDFTYAICLTMLHLSRLAEDWILYSSEEFGFLEMGEEVSSGSSLMPQKKNPDALELVRGKAGRVSGHLLALMMTLKGLPVAYNRDLQEDKEPIFDAAAQLTASLKVTRLVIETIKINREKMETAADEGWGCATALAELLAEKGVSFNRAHQLVGKLVTQSVHAGKQPKDWTRDELVDFAPEFDGKAVQLLSSRQVLQNHAVAGGTAPISVMKSLQQAEQRLAKVQKKS